MLQQKARVLWNKEIAPSYFRIGLECSYGFARIKPGQFVMVRISDGVDPLLRRPFSVHKPIVKKNRTTGIELLYKVVGKGTNILSGLSADANVNILGPLGSAFLLPPGAKKIMLVAGGIGVAPMVFLAMDLIKDGIDPEDCRVFLVGRSTNDLLCIEEFKRLNMAVTVTTDDGSAGDQCLVTVPMDFAVTDARPDIIYTCGPEAMLECVMGIARAHSITCQLSIETRMACGMGSCLGCAVTAADMPDRYYHACLDGPVFDSESIRFDT
jgi:dihydroorotate dehydrogenase electron transfer subunit